MFEKQVVIDCRGHLIGRLATVIAKELLRGQRIVLVCTRGSVELCTGALRGGQLQRISLKFHAYLNKKTNTNPRRGHIHYRNPAIRGMVPHKSSRGAAAMERLKVFEGVPPPFDKIKRVVVPSALRILRLAPGRKFCVLKVGWTYGGIVEKLEEKRKTRSHQFYLAKNKAVNKKAANMKNEKLTKVNAELAKFGY